MLKRKKGRMSAKEFLSLPIEEQEKRLKEQSKEMAKNYELIEDNQELLDY
ncbi:MAG: hypothetical protein U0354_09705 [Candidatus Sericytochromatia bacterium]